MDTVKQKWKKTLIAKTWERYKSFGSRSKKSSSCMIKKSKSWPSIPKSSSTSSSSSSSSSPERSEKRQVAPAGYFSVYVGPQKQRFVIKIKLANHHLFKTLLEDAESEYGYKIQGPITLPCDVDLFYKVLAEMESTGDEIDTGCRFVKSPLTLMSPVRRPNARVNDNGYGAYRPLGPSRMMKMNSI